MGLLIRRLLFAVGLVLVAGGFAALVNDRSTVFAALFVFIGGFMLAVAILRHPPRR